MNTFVALIAIFAAAAVPAFAQPIDANPWRGYARICLAENGATQCTVLQTEMVFDTRDECLEQTRARIERAVNAAFTETRPENLSVRIACAPDRSLVNTSW